MDNALYWCNAFQQRHRGLKNMKTAYKAWKKGHKCEASSASIPLPLQEVVPLPLEQPVLHPCPLEIKESPRQTGLTAVPISAV